MRGLKSHASPKNVKGMKRFGINTTKALGVAAPTLKKLAKKIGTNHRLALQLWSTGILETRGLASLIDDPKLVKKKQMEQWVKDFDNWAVCNACCRNLFDKTPYAFRKAVEWSKRKEEFVKRAGFAMMAELAVHDKEAGDEKFLRFLPIIKRESTDERNFVKKAVNWALRQIGKRNLKLNAAAIRAGKEIQRMDLRAAKWIAADALREMRSESVQRRLRMKQLFYFNFGRVNQPVYLTQN